MTTKPKKSKKIKEKLQDNTVKYCLNHEFEFFYELRELILKSSPAEKHEMIKKINAIGKVKMALISGILINKEHKDQDMADLFIVADDVDKRRLHNLLKFLEAEVGKEVTFAIMEKEEFQYRLGMFDRFVGTMLDKPHEKLINRLGI